MVEQPDKATYGRRGLFGLVVLRGDMVCCGGQDMAAGREGIIAGTRGQLVTLPHTRETARMQEVEQGGQVSRPTPVSHFFQRGSAS